MDFGALFGGYHADMTRTIAFGEPASELKKIHDVVRQAQQAGIDAVAEGVTGAEVDAAARGSSRRRLRTTGSPTGSVTASVSTSTRAEARSRVRRARCPRAVVTVEPGVYVPRLGWRAHRGHGRGDARRVPRARQRVAELIELGRTDRTRRHRELNVVERFHERLQERHDPGARRGVVPDHRVPACEAGQGRRLRAHEAGT